MAELIIKRTSEWNSKMRDINIYLDECKIGVIGNGETKKFVITPGKPHLLKAKIDWCESQEIPVKLANKQIQEIELSGFKYGKWLLPLTLILCVTFFALEKPLHLDSTLFLILISCSAPFFFYYLTIGRKNYLQLKKL